MRAWLLFLCSVCFVYGSSSSQTSSKTYLFVGTYTNGKPGKGIYVYTFDMVTGKLKLASHTQNIINPSFVSVSPHGQFLYACTDTKLPGTGSITVFKIDSTNGNLTFVSKQSSGGENPVYLVTHPDQPFFVNVNYTEGNVSVFKTNEQGRIDPYKQLVRLEGSSINKERQEKPHPHSAVFSPDKNYVIIPDLGSDKIRVFRFDPTADQPLTPAADLTVPIIPGSGPRHITFHPVLPIAYCTDELSGTVSAYAYHNGKLDLVQRIFSYSKIQESYGSSDLHVSPDGLFLYAANRWDDENTITIFSIDQQSGQLKRIGHQPTFGDHPRSFILDPTGKFLLVANQVSGTIIVFRRDAQSGLLTRTGHQVRLPEPSCLQMRTYSIPFVR